MDLLSTTKLGYLKLAVFKTPSRNQYKNIYFEIFFLWEQIYLILCTQKFIYVFKAKHYIYFIKKFLFRHFSKFCSKLTCSFIFVFNIKNLFISLFFLITKGMFSWEHENIRFLILAETYLVGVALPFVENNKKKCSMFFKPPTISLYNCLFVSLLIYNKHYHTQTWKNPFKRWCSFSP